MPNRSFRGVVRGIRVLIAVLITLAGLIGILLPALEESAQAQSAESGNQQPKVLLVRLDGAIDGVSSQFIERGLDRAEEKDFQLVVLMLNTPGGLLDATRDIIESILVSEIPIAVYVAPDGAQAASAGTFVGAAAHILAMAPTTNIGAASVVGVDGGDLPDTLSRKASQDAAAFIRSIAETRGRNVSALEETVLSAKAYSASEAVELGIADLIAVDYDSLLEQLDGYPVDINGETVELAISGAVTSQIDLSLLERVLTFISNPNIAFLLVSLGGLGVIVELWNPGLWVPGTLGVLFLVLGWAGVGQLPFSWAGVALILLSMLLFYLETTAPGIGYFGVAGTVTLILGGVFLVGFFGNPTFTGTDPVVNRWLLSIVGVSFGSLVLWFAWELRKSTRILLYESPTAAANIVGVSGVVSADLSPSGQVLVNGEIWSGEYGGDGDKNISAGTEVEVVSVDGIHLKVRPLRTETGTDNVSSKD
ncbi:MAG: nodulation protein NfeD [Chloroflexi bacterium]|nr:nodulation protein NfeD [Chloroflexota bacterium]MBT7467983.1 nodulation protein NfeD [Chloroflexota bacterium]